LRKDLSTHSLHKHGMICQLWLPNQSIKCLQMLGGTNLIMGPAPEVPQPQM
jgi:hypothetical protein